MSNSATRLIALTIRRRLVSARPATLIYNDWYPALRSSTLGGKQLRTTLLLGIPLVLGRKDGWHTLRHARQLSAPRYSALLRLV